MNSLTKPACLIAIVVAVVIGTAYGSKIPVLGPLAKKLPGASL